MVIRQEQFINSKVGTLDGAINDSVTSMDINDATGWPTGGDFRVQIEDEILLITEVTGVTWVVQRGMEGTTAVAHSDTENVSGITTKGGIDQWLRDRDPWVNTRPPYKLQDINGVTLDNTDFTETNFSHNAVASMVNGNIYLRQDDHTIESIAALLRVAPSTPYTITAALTQTAWGDNAFDGPFSGLIFYENATADSVVLALQPGNFNGYRILRYNSLTSFNSSTLSIAPQPELEPVWLRISDDGTTLRFYVGMSGGVFVEIHSELRTASFATAPDRVGFCHNAINTEPATLYSAGTLVGWNES